MDLATYDPEDTVITIYVLFCCYRRQSVYMYAHTYVRNPVD